VDAVVGLDPSYGSQPERVLSAPSFHADQFHVPLLTLRSGHPMYNVRDRSAVIRALTHADRYTADVGRGSHGDFGDSVVLEVALSLVRPGEPRTAAEGVAAYHAVVAGVRSFLDGTLRGDRAALDALAKGNGNEQLRMTVDRAVR